ncbi:MAG: tetratricopeptide repeat protein, partial [Candidatus Omnitrophica bacterium]|nr:tetratricopeptide repeat protein [Candidatus Omnitrophota bacterium]
SAFYPYQDWYFSKRWILEPRSISFFGQERVSDPAFARFFRAGNYHLWRRFEKARFEYEKLLENETHWSDDALFFLGRSYLEEGLAREAAGPLVTLRRRYPSSFWFEPSTYWLGLCYEELGEVNLARKLFEEIKTVQGLDAAVRLSRNVP